jgi:hypothetical protein
MLLTTLKTFRHEVSGMMKRAKDALFNLADALLTEEQATSLVELSLLPHFERKWFSIYKALEDGKIDQK